MDTYLRYWGKARPDDTSGSVAHRLVYHSLDVAAVGAVWWDADPGLRARMASLLGLSAEGVRALLLWLLALHDLGKFAGSFQALSEDGARAVEARLPGKIVGGTRHDAWSVEFREEILFQSMSDATAVLFDAVAGHHGRPARRNISPGRGYDPDDLAAAVKFASVCASAMGLVDMPALTFEDIARAQRASWLVAGVAVVCDWIGSNTSWFPYRLEPMALDAYWRDVALPRARIAIDAAGIVPARFASNGTPADLLPERAEATPLQRAAAAIPLGGGPQLHLIEDLTGAGKTESALILARRMIAAGLGDGLFVALPTQATTNAMWRRVGGLRTNLMAPGETPTVVLAHGARDLALRAMAPGPAERGPDPSAHESTAARDATAWLADDKRKAMLADIGIGTIDQAVLSVHPEKFQSLRLAGLARKILILDEVHAYDAYMTEQIETLLRFQATLGGSAILLSATLSAEQRTRFSKAFCASLNRPFAEAVAEFPFPALTSVDAHFVRTYPIDPAPRAPRRVGIVNVSPEAALSRTIELARAGACVCWLRNTVGDALAAAAELTAVAPELAMTVFHARFAMVDRLAIETGILDRFGKIGDAAGRRGQVVIATQVVEQSLDVDFDEMVTDLAPVDLLIQRAGRVRRHNRPGREGQANLHVVQPNWCADPDAGWYRRVFPAAALVYKDHAALWRTARVLRDEGALDLPGRLRALIESVHGPEADTPPGLQEISDRAVGARHGDRATARVVILTPEAGYSSGQIWTADAQAATRLGDPQVTLRLARRTALGVRPWAADGDLWRAWLSSQVRVRKALIDGAPRFPDIDAIYAGWPDRDDPAVLLIVLEPMPDGGWQGQASRRERPVTLRYDERWGLRVLRQ
jgi:CRISPR-associated endonuclease/helicase Cas3